MPVSLSTSFPTPAEPAPVASKSAGKLQNAAQEFEAILLQSWLEKMNKSFAGCSESQDPAHDTVSSLGTQAIASALAARGGIGIARMLLRQVQSPERAVQVRTSGNLALSDSGLGRLTSR